VSQEGTTTIRPLSADAAETVQTDHGSLVVLDDQQINHDILSRRLGMGSLQDHVSPRVDLVQLTALAARVKEATS